MIDSRQDRNLVRIYICWIVLEGVYRKGFSSFEAFNLVKITKLLMPI